MPPPTPSPTPPLRWPKIALLFGALFVLACVLFMIKEVKRVKSIREATDEMRSSKLQTSPPPANATAPARE